MHTHYQYTTPAGPVQVIVSDTSLCNTHTQQRYKKEAIIRLTPNDIQAGKDIFDLTLLHIKERSEQVSGTDVFANMTFDPKRLRVQIESVLRHMLIDIREMVIRNSKPTKAFQQQCQTILDRVRLGIYYIRCGDTYPLQRLQQAISYLDEQLDTNACNCLYATTFIGTCARKQLTDIHDSLLQLTKKIDQL